MRAPPEDEKEEEEGQLCYVVPHVHVCSLLLCYKFHFLDNFDNLKGIAWVWVQGVHRLKIFQNVTNRNDFYLPLTKILVTLSRFSPTTLNNYTCTYWYWESIDCIEFVLRSPPR